MKTFALFVMLAVSMDIGAVTYVNPTIPGTNARDLSAPGTAIDDDQIYSTIPGSTARDLTRGGYKRQGSTWVPTLPASRARDFSRPSYRAYGNNGRMVVPVLNEDDEDRNEDQSDSALHSLPLPTPCPPAMARIGECP